jgi:hypothetical protein
VTCAQLKAIHYLLHKGVTVTYSWRGFLASMFTQFSKKNLPTDITKFMVFHFFFFSAVQT